MKNLYLFLFVAFLGGFIQSCSNNNDLISIQQEQKTFIENNINEFKKKYISTKVGQEYHENSIKLFGFQTIYIEKEGREALREFVEDHNNKIPDHHYISKDYSYVRIYYPLSDAIIEIDGDEYLTNKLGIIKINNDTNLSTLKLIGRKKSENILGTKNNIIKGNKIFFREQKKETYCQDNQILIFDFGDLCSCEHDNSDMMKTTMGIPCYQNHGNKNCTTAFGIAENEGRCTFQEKICMDYNCPNTDCKKYRKTHWKRYRNFVGSDCDYAMGQGDCWNELM